MLKSLTSPQGNANTMKKTNLTDKSKITVAFFIDSIWSLTGGTEVQLINIIKNIDKIIFNPIICCHYKSEWMKKNFDLCPVYEIGFKSITNPKSWLKIISFSSLLKTINCQIVMCYFRDANISATIAAKLAGVPVIIPNRRSKGHWHNAVDIVLLRLINKFATKILTNSEDVRYFTHEREKVSLSKIDVIYNGVDLAKFTLTINNEKQKLRTEYNIPTNSIIGTVVANLRPVKGLDVLLKAIPEILKSIPNFLLLIVGKDLGEKSKLDKIIESKNISQQVQFLGLRSDIQNILKLSDIGILPSRSESLSNAIVEYISVGLPVIATDVGGTKELILHGENGFLVKKEDSSGLARAVVKAFSSDSTLRNMSTMSRSRAKNMFDIKIQTKCYEDYFLKLLNEGR